MNRDTLFFTAPGQVEISAESITSPGPGEVLVKALLRAISPGTEMLFYRGQAPRELCLDANIPSLEGKAIYPFKYGYSMVGQVVELGPDVDPALQNTKVFTFHPHESLFCASMDELIPLPGSLSAEDAVFLPSTETAVNFVMDGAPLIGEDVAVFGLGVVGLLTTCLLAQFPLGSLTAYDPIPQRRAIAQQAARVVCFDPQDSPVYASEYEGVDLAFELSGAPAALQQAIVVTGYAGRIVVGSWYGRKPVTLDLGGKFHRSRIRLISSQVSTIAPILSGRWDKGRRFNSVWKQIERIAPQKWITHYFSLRQAAQAYQLLSEHPEETLQVVIDYRQPG